MFRNLRGGNGVASPRVQDSRRRQDQQVSLHRDSSLGQSRKSVIFLLWAAAFSALSFGCGRSQSSVVQGDAAHPIPVQVYTVAEETTRRNVQAVGSLYALEESTLSAEVAEFEQLPWREMLVRLFGRLRRPAPGSD